MPNPTDQLQPKRPQNLSEMVGQDKEMQHMHEMTVHEMTEDQGFYDDAVNATIESKNAGRFENGRFVPSEGASSHTLNALFPVLNSAVEEAAGPKYNYSGKVLSENLQRHYNSIKTARAKLLLSENYTCDMAEDIASSNARLGVRIPVSEVIGDFEAGAEKKYAKPFAEMTDSNRTVPDGLPESGFYEAIRSCIECGFLTGERLGQFIRIWEIFRELEGTGNDEGTSTDNNRESLLEELSGIAAAESRMKSFLAFKGGDDSYRLLYNHNTIVPESATRARNL